MARRPRVVYWLQDATPAMVRRCNAVVRQDAVELEVWFNRQRAADRNWELAESDWLFQYRYVRPARLSLLHYVPPIRELAEAKIDLFVQEYDRWFLAAGFLAARATAARTAFRVLPNYDQVSERTWWRELSKRFLFRAVDAAKVPGPEGAALARRYGLPLSRTHGVVQSIDVAQFAAARSLPTELRALRRESLGLSGCVFVYVGRLLRRKGLDYLFDAYEQLIASDVDASLLLVGDGLDERHFRQRASDLPRVVFRGFVQEAELPELYALADIMVFPTLGDAHGLVVEEALAAGLPVITSSAAGDSYLRVEKPGVGYVVRPDSAVELEQRMRELAGSEALRLRMAARTHEIVSSRTDDRYAAEFVAFVQAVLATPPRRTRAAQAARLLGRAAGRGTALQPAGRRSKHAPGHSGAP